MRFVLHPVSGGRHDIERQSRLKLLQPLAPLGEIGRGGRVVLAPDAGEPAHVTRTSASTRAPPCRARYPAINPPMEKPAILKCVCAPMIASRPCSSIAAMPCAEYGGCGLADSPEPGRSGTITNMSRASD